MLVLVVQGLFCKLNFPYAQFTCASTDGDLFFDTLWKAESCLEMLVFCELGLTCDGELPNSRLWKLHNDILRN